jgi:hypothetical protein
LITNTQSQRLPDGRNSGGLGEAATQSEVAIASYGIVESPAEQSWTDFCRSLNRPAFLLGESGFDSLEQT